MSKQDIAALDGAVRDLAEDNARLHTINSELLAALVEFVRIDEESGLQAGDGGELISALREARTALAKTRQQA